MMRTSTNGLRLIQYFEGLTLVPYRCPAGYLTVGYGHRLMPTERIAPITQETAEAMLTRDVRLSEASVAALVPVPLNQEQFDALVSFTFNLGSGALQRSRLRQKILRGEMDAAVQEFFRWVYAKGRKLPGLIRRRAAEARLFQGVDWAG